MRRSIILSYFQFLSDEAKKCKNGPNDFLKGRSGHFELKLARGGLKCLVQPWRCKGGHLGLSCLYLGISRGVLMCSGGNIRDHSL